MRRRHGILTTAAFAAVLTAAIAGVLTADCATTLAPEPGDDQAATTPAQASADPAHERHPAGVTVRLDGDDIIELRLGDGETFHRWTLGDGESLHSFLVHPDASADTVDVVALVLDGERPLLRYVTARPGGASGIAQFPDHQQPSHEVDAGPPALAWTPDGRSLVWIEPSGGSTVLRVVGWEDGPATGNPADDSTTFVLEVPGGVQVDGFEVTSESSWTLLLRGGGSTEPITIPVERQPDGALALRPER